MATSSGVMFEKPPRDLFLFKGNSLNCQFCRAVNFRIAGFLFSGGFAAFGEYLGAHVAAGFGPLVVLLGEDGADEADDGVAAGEDPDHVGPPPDFLVEPFPRDYSDATLAAVREHAASLDESALLLMDEHSCVQDIARRCDELIKRQDQRSHATRDGDRF